MDKQPQSDVVAQLMSQGIDKETALRMVGEVAEEWRQKAVKQKERYKRFVWMGIGLFVTGVILSAIFTFQVYWFVILAGLIFFFSGARRLNELSVET